MRRQDIHTIPAPGTRAKSGIATRLVPRLCSARQAARHFAFWIQLRGSSRIEAREGAFRLVPGGWIALDPDSGSTLQADHDGLAIGLLLPETGASRKSTASDYGLYPGNGRMTRDELRLTLRLWRDCAAQQDDRAFRPLLLQLRHLQRGLHALVDRCPGRTIRRRRQVFARLQRMRMMLEGNVHRSVRLGELAAMGQFSDWWVSKTFHAVYGETIQRTAIRLRMERARELLRDTTLSIGEIGEMCGIQDPCSFARQFKAWHGVTASQWRLEHQTQRQKNHDEQADLSTVFSRTGT